MQERCSGCWRTAPTATRATGAGRRPQRSDARMRGSRGCFRNNTRAGLMPIAFVSGDLFANRFQARALAHGCNCQGSMGAGIATGFRDRYPAMYAEYRRRCKAEPRAFNLGDAWLWKAAGQPWVFNLGTQEGVWRARASYEAIEIALTSMRRQA